MYTVLIIPDFEEENEGYDEEKGYPGGIEPGIYSVNDVAEMLRRNAENPEAIRFIADM